MDESTDTELARLRVRRILFTAIIQILDLMPPETNIGEVKNGVGELMLGDLKREQELEGLQ